VRFSIGAGRQAPTLAEYAGDVQRQVGGRVLERSKQGLVRTKQRGR
jgi:hypothetical protein